MKCAVIGSGPVAILAAQYFDQMGAEVTLFQRSALGGQFKNFITDQTSSVLWNNQEFSSSTFFEEVIKPAVLSLEEFKLTKQGDVLRVHKRFLYPDEVIEGHTRLYDLFRVIYSLNPRETILKQLEENPEMFKALGEEVIQSLHKPVENFLDFDIIIEARGYGRESLPMGAGQSFALNELNLKDNSALFYEEEIFNQFQAHNQKSIVLVGNKELSGFVLLHLKSWLLENPERELHWICPQATRASTKNPRVEKDVESFVNELESQFEKAKKVFEKAIHDWRDLEDYIKVKVPMPKEPVSQLRIYNGYDVTSVDRLLDQEGLFVTIERPEYRQRDNSDAPLMMTLKADAILVTQGKSTESLGSGFSKDNEPGYYNLNGVSLTDLSYKLEEIKTDLMSYFKKSENE
jgi:hypothetical protein